MTVTTFDPLGYAKKLESVGFSREQAEVQANVLRELADERAVTREYLDSRMREQELRLQAEIKAAELRLLKWQLGIGFAIVVIMAKGFGWIGF